MKWEKQIIAMTENKSSYGRFDIFVKICFQNNK